MAQLRREKRKFDDAGVRVVLVGMGTAEESEAFRKDLDVPFSIVADPERILYRAFDLERMSALGMLSPRTVVRGVFAMAKGHVIGKPVGDVLQLPGVFVIGTDGRPVFSHYGSHPADHPSPEEILRAVQADRRLEAGHDAP